LMGLPKALKAWRAAAGHKRGRPLTQGEVGRRAGHSSKWYERLEKGAVPQRKDCAALADILGLDEEARYALYLYATGSAEDVPVPQGGRHVSSALQILLERQMPAPAYLCDRHWNILAYNAAMAEWWPWVMEPGANLMRWALTDPEARIQFHDWPAQAARFISLIKFAGVSRHDDTDLLALIRQVKTDPDVQRIWKDVVEVRKSLDGDVHRMILPALGWETVDLVGHLSYPASMPDCRLVTITWLQHDDDTEAENQAPGGTDPMVAPWADTAAAQAGPGAVPLPVLSALVGPDTQLTLAPHRRKVVWATRRSDGTYKTAEVDAYTVITRMTEAAANPQAHQDMKALTRAVFPPDAELAADRIRTLVKQLSRRLSLFHEIYDDLQAQAPDLPAIEQPVHRPTSPPFEQRSSA
ncbi:helix-turn-helix transcriptional regulator, partial [Streptomyces sp. HPF1205]|uniref:helix-turn-helix transcriptional regulator n=1 Tax=Streptomyces sp. HPF1205 TaxID=2873262 RepID=UPI001CEC261F